MPKTNEVRANVNNSSVQSTSSHETAYSVINGNVLNLLISLRTIEQSFKDEYMRLVLENKDAKLDFINEMFYESYGQMQEALKSLLAETTEVNINNSL